MIKISIRGKLMVGFGAVLLVTILVSVSTFVQVQNNTTITNRLNHLRQPTVLAGATLEDGINQSLAGLRGYIILGSDPEKAKIFKAERLSGWQKIDESFATLSGFSENWTDPNNLELLEKIKSNLHTFKLVQEKIEAISHTSENIPAIDMLLNQAGPAASQVLGSLNRLIDEEERLPSTVERKRLLKLLADSRGSFALGLANIRAYLLSGDQKFVNLFDDHWRTNEARFKSLSDVSHLFKATQGADWQDYQNTRLSFSELPRKMFEMRSSEKWNKANFLLGTKAAPRALEIKKLLVDMRQSQNQLMVVDQKNSQSTTKLVNSTVLIGTLIALIVGTGIALYISRLISNPLVKIVATAESIANKDLSSQPLDESSGDELATLSIAINQMSSTLRDVIQQVLEASEKVSDTSKSSYELNQKTSGNLDDQQSQTEQIATAINEMNATVQEVSTNINGTADAAHKANLETVNGRDIVNQTISSIHELHKQVEQAAEVIEELERNSGGINSIMDVIKGVAEQTNLLALNAAIEAARAGEQGRGFAVVADEVRTLAGKTQTSTEEINQMIEKLQAGTKQAVEVIKKSREQAGQVSEQANEAGDSLTEIAQSVSVISDMSTQIAAAAEEQLAVTEEINRNVVAINDLSKETSIAAKESSQSSHDLHFSAIGLQSLVAEFKI